MLRCVDCVDQLLVTCGEWGVCHFRIVGKCNFRGLCVSNLYEHKTEVVLPLKLMVGGAEQKEVFDESGFREYCKNWYCRFNFLFLKK